MKRFQIAIFMILIGLLTLNFGANAMSSGPQYTIVEDEEIANLEIIEDFYSPDLDTTKRIWIYLPPDYYESDKSYPVLYMQDGQKLFSNAQGVSWNIDKTMEEIYSEGLMDGVIIVGIESEDPLREFVPFDYWVNPSDFVDNTLGEEYLTYCY